jgi:hypothetical protein
MLKKTYDVVYWDEEGNREIVNSFDNYSEAYQCFMKCMESDKQAQINQSYDIEEGHMGVPGH